MDIRLGGKVAAQIYLARTNGRRSNQLYVENMGEVITLEKYIGITHILEGRTGNRPWRASAVWTSRLPTVSEGGKIYTKQINAKEEETSFLVGEIIYNTHLPFLSVRYLHSVATLIGTPALIHAFIEDQVTLFRSAPVPSAVLDSAYCVFRHAFLLTTAVQSGYRCYRSLPVNSRDCCVWKSQQISRF